MDIFEKPQVSWNQQCTEVKAEMDVYFPPTSICDPWLGTVQFPIYLMGDDRIFQDTAANVLPIHRIKRQNVSWG